MWEITLLEYLQERLFNEAQMYEQAKTPLLVLNLNVFENDSF